MDMNRSGGIRSSWIPGTPLKPGLTRQRSAIGAGEDENELIDAVRLDSEMISSNLREESRVVVEKIGTEDHNVDPMEEFKNVRFTDLLALQHSKRDLSFLEEAACKVPEMTGGVMETCSSHLKFGPDPVESTQANLLVEFENFLGSNCATEKPENRLAVPHWHSDNINLLPEAMTDAVSSKSVQEFAPLTPDKVKRAESKHVSDGQNAHIHEGMGMERKKPESKVVTARFDGYGLQQEKGVQPTEDSSVSPISIPHEKNHNNDNEVSNDIQTNKTSQQKSRKKKHRPKVVKEGKPKTTPMPTTPKPTRMYVRRKELNKPTSAPAETPEPAKRSCRRGINFETEEQFQDEGFTCKSTSNVGSEVQAQDLFTREAQSEVTAQSIKVGLAYDLTCIANQKLNQYISLPERQDPGTPISTNTNPEQSCQVTSVKIPDSPTQSTGTQSAPISTCSTTAIPTELDEGRGSKRNYSYDTEQTHISHTNLIGVHDNNLQPFEMAPCMHFSNFYKKTRTEEQYSTTSSTSSSVTASNSIRTVTPSPNQDAQADKYDCTLTYNQSENLTRKRSRGLTEVHDLSSFTRIAGCKRSEQTVGNGDMQRVENSQQTYACNAALARMNRMLARKKCGNKRNYLDSASSSTNEVNVHQRIDISSKYIQTYSRTGTIVSVNTIIEQMKCLDINREQNAFTPRNFRNKEHNSLVVYRREGTMVTTEVSVKKRRPRAKVHLDDETTRVWKLLLGNINSEGIDGTDEEKKKWWEEERRVFCGRADSFIARMHLVQGDRRFSQWKGSVVDSVVGVFLTQNVSDHLSSSAFMSLASCFPLKSNSDGKPVCKEGLIYFVREPEMCTLNPEDSLKRNEKSNQPVSTQCSTTLNEKDYHKGKKVINGTDFGISADDVSSTNELTCKLLNPAESGFEIYHDSSQNSVKCSITQTAERIGSSSENNSEEIYLKNGIKANSWDGSMSFTKHLEMVGSSMLHEACIHRSDSLIPGENSMDAHNQIKNMEYDKQNQNMNSLDGPGSFLASCRIAPSSYHLHLFPNSGVPEVQCSEMLKGETRSSDKNKNCTSEESILTADSASQSTVQSNLTAGTQEASNFSRENNKSSNGLQGGKNSIASCENSVAKDPKIESDALAQGTNIKMQRNLNSQTLSGEKVDLRESISVSDSMENNTKCKTAGVDLSENGNSSSEKNMSKGNALKSNSREVGKEKKKESDWDFLRKQAEANGRKRERTADTVDSIDWEAVRCADVKEIAYTIRERGMNNVLAGRIQDFLNRLVSKHESINLEWLRDVPPDKAKEYLLSIRGLGLKSVECVRLLTLHHLAFPVDTNVGRIAVRLGWVPLQPLPESLQLHLLELYPVLESIQKYLWPRLCKLDQRTLLRILRYELHYQMITFGKVFCTKNKPNCNACPMRGECRHFASAFASARLALPGLEEKSIVSKIEETTANQNPAAHNVISSLSPPQTTQTPDQAEESQMSSLESDAKSGVNKCEPIVEEPATPEQESANVPEIDIEDTFYEDPNEIPIIKLNMEEFTNNLQNYMQGIMEIQEGDVSKALVALTPEIASIPMPKLKRVNQLRTEHLVYELPDSHPLLIGVDRREPDDPCSYLLAIWGPGETADSIEPPEGCCSSSPRDTQTVRGTLLVPCRTAMKGSFPLNGTYFQVNEVFSDHETSLNPIEVPRDWLWNLPRRTVFFGTSIPSIFKGLSTEDIQKCFWRGYVCVRGFDRTTRAPRPLIARLHFPASKLGRTKAKSKMSEKIV